jgi:hypothetical protein
VTSKATPAKRTDAITKADFMFDSFDDRLTQLVPHWYDRLVFICRGRSNIKHQQILHHKRNIGVVENYTVIIVIIIIIIIIIIMVLRVCYELTT